MYKLLLILICATFSISAQSNDHLLSVQNTWLETSYYLIKNTPGYSAPVAARTYAFQGLLMQTVKNESKILKKFPELSFANFEEKESWKAYYLNELNYQFALYFYQNGAIAEKNYMQSVRDSIGRLVRPKKSKKTARRIMDLAKTNTQIIIDFSQKDGADQCWNKNFPKEYKIEYCDSCWLKTYPGYLPALLPYWGKNNLLLSTNEFRDSLVPPDFSLDTNSTFYKEANTMYQLLGAWTVEQETIAQYWDDGAGVSGTPAGHLFQIAKKYVIQNQFSFDEAIDVYATLGIAINDAVINCWHQKYAFNLIRPITYIQRYIGEDFVTSIATPPFPEYPSGHSMQAGAANAVFNYFFANQSPIMDDTQVQRTDIDGSARRYPNWDAMAAEMSQSRYFGGIHFPTTLSRSLDLGKKIGQATIQNLFP